MRISMPDDTEIKFNSYQTSLESKSNDTDKKEKKLQ